MSGPSVEETALAPQHTERLAGADSVGQHGTPGHGPFLVVYLKIEADTVTAASCRTYGCPAAIACGSKLAAWVRGKTLADAWGLTPGMLRSMFADYPPGKRHCSKVAVSALRDAIKRYRASRETTGELTGNGGEDR